jgi:hypothetical protein
MEAQSNCLFLDIQLQDRAGYYPSVETVQMKFEVGHSTGPNIAGDQAKSDD